MNLLIVIFKVIVSILTIIPIGFFCLILALVFLDDKYIEYPTMISNRIWNR